jgi:hypothetical protein
MVTPPLPPSTENFAIEILNMGKLYTGSDSNSLDNASKT